MDRQIMSYEVSLDTDPAIQLASNQGYYDLCDWIEELDEDDYPLLAELAAEGINSPAGAIADELRSALEDDPPDDTVESTARLLLRHLTKGDPDAVVIFSNGMGNAEIHDEYSDDGDDEGDGEEIARREAG
jgi:hypothetical protein